MSFGWYGFMLFHKAHDILTRLQGLRVCEKEWTKSIFTKVADPDPEHSGTGSWPIISHHQPRTKAHNPCGNQQGQEPQRDHRSWCSRSLSTAVAQSHAGPCGRRPVTWLSSGSQCEGLSEQWRYLIVVWLLNMIVYDHAWFYTIIFYDYVWVIIVFIYCYIIVYMTIYANCVYIYIYNSMYIYI